MKNKITEQNWEKEFRNRFVKNEGSIVGDYELWDDSAEPEEAINFIQSLITSIKQEERDYTESLEIALIFMCECYVSARDMIAGVRENNQEVDDKYADLWFHFPLIQGSSNIFSVEKISELRTLRGNRESNKMSMKEIYEKMKNNSLRTSLAERKESIRKAIQQSLTEEDIKNSK